VQDLGAMEHKKYRRWKNTLRGCKKSIEYLEEKKGRKARIITLNKEVEFAANFKSKKLVWKER